MNPILKDVVNKIDQISSDPESQEQYGRIVLAGKKIMFDKATHDKISWLKDPEDLAVLVNGVFDLITIITELSGNAVKPDPLHGAAVVLTMEALDFAARVNDLEITPEIAKAAVQAIDEKMSELNLNSNGGAPGQPPEQPPELGAQEAEPQGLIDTKEV